MYLAALHHCDKVRDLLVQNLQAPRMYPSFAGPFKLNGDVAARGETNNSSQWSVTKLNRAGLVGFCWKSLPLVNVQRLL